MNVMTSPENALPSPNPGEPNPEDTHPLLDEDAGDVHNAHYEVGGEDDPEGWH